MSIQLQATWWYTHREREALGFFFVPKCVKTIETKIELLAWKMKWEAENLGIPLYFVPLHCQKFRTVIAFSSWGSNCWQYWHCLEVCVVRSNSPHIRTISVPWFWSSTHWVTLTQEIYHCALYLLNAEKPAWPGNRFT